MCSWIESPPLSLPVDLELAVGPKAQLTAASSAANRVLNWVPAPNRGGENSPSLGWPARWARGRFLSEEMIAGDAVAL
jgi:hypothetical protein